MNYEKLDLVLKVAGSGMSGVGSILLAWRVKSIIKWVVYSLVAHEVSIEQISKILNGGPQTGTIVSGVPKHLLEFQDKTGLCLMIVGFASLGLGMLLSMVQYLL
jgi:hypothetical protein